MIDLTAPLGVVSDAQLVMLIETLLERFEQDGDAVQAYDLLRIALELQDRRRTDRATVR